MDCWLRKSPIVETLLFREHRRVAVPEVDFLPAKPLASLVTPVAENLCAPHAGVREKIRQSAVAAGFDRGFSILADVVDRVTRLFVDEVGELLAIFG